MTEHLNPDWKRIRPPSRPDLHPGESRFYICVDSVRFGTLRDVIDNPHPPEVLAHVGKARAMVDRYDDIMAILAEVAEQPGVLGQLARNVHHTIESAPPAESSFGTRSHPFGPLKEEII